MQSKPPPARKQVSDGLQAHTSAFQVCVGACIEHREHAQACRRLLAPSAEISWVKLKDLEEIKGDFAAGSVLVKGGL